MVPFGKDLSRSLPLSLSEGFEMTNADLVVVPAGKEYFSS